MGNTAKLDALKARAIREAFTRGRTVEQLVSQYGVSDQAIKDVLNFETWASAGGPRLTGTLPAASKHRSG